MTWSHGMRTALKVRFSFGLTSGVITTLGLMVGLHAGTHSMPAVLGDSTIALADAMSDALGIHVAEESKTTGIRTTSGRPRPRRLWRSSSLPPPLRCLCCSCRWTWPLWPACCGADPLALLSYALARAQRGAALESHRRACDHRTLCRGRDTLCR